MLYVVALNHTCGTISFVSNSTWGRTHLPQAVFKLAEAEKKAAFWKEVSLNKAYDVTLVTVDIKPAIIEVSAEVTQILPC